MGVATCTTLHGREPMRALPEQCDPLDLMYNLSIRKTAPELQADVAHKRAQLPSWFYLVL